jgi:hypothetical protein
MDHFLLLFLCKTLGYVKQTLPFPRYRKRRALWVDASV